MASKKQTPPELKIVQRNIDELIFAEYNPRQLKEHQFKQLRDSLTRFGMVDQVLVNVHPERANVIIGGHQRTFVWKSMGNTTIPTVELNLTLDQEKELNIRLNKNSGEWDYDMLANVFDTQELKDWGFQDYELSFYDNKEIDTSILDGEDVSGELGRMTDGVKKAIQIEFESEHYEEAAELVKFFRDKGAYIGGLLMEKLKQEKDNL